MRYEIPVPLQLKLSMNQRMHWAVKNQHTQALRTVAKLGAKTQAIGAQAERVDVGLTWFVTDGRKRDADNLAPTLKALCDGLVDAGVVPDDTPGYMRKLMPEIVREIGKGQRLTFWVRTFDQFGEDAA